MPSLDAVLVAGSKGATVFGYLNVSDRFRFKPDGQLYVKTSRGWFREMGVLGTPVGKSFRTSTNSTVYLVKA